MHFQTSRSRNVSTRRPRTTRNRPILAREGIPLARYHWPSLVPGAVMGAGLWAYLRLVASSSREILFHHPSRIPSNALICMYEGDNLLTYSSPRFWRSAGQGLSWLGSHGFFSYLSSFGGWWSGRKCHRTDRRVQRRAFDQVLDYLRFRRLGRFVVQADADGPRGRVRASLVDLCLETRRPIIAVRQRCDRALRLRGRAIPLPFCTVATTISEAIYPEDFSGLTREQAQARLQRLMDRI